MNEPRGAAMFLKTFLLSLGCVLAWLVLLPLLFIGGGVALFAQAIFAEFGALFLGNTGTTVDATAAREIARRMCGGYGVQARNMRRHPAPKDFDVLNGVAGPTSTSS
jgi:hypothetical protein